MSERAEDDARGAFMEGHAAAIEFHMRRAVEKASPVTGALARRRGAVAGVLDEDRRRVGVALARGYADAYRDGRLDEYMRSPRVEWASCLDDGTWPTRVNPEGGGA